MTVIWQAYIWHWKGQKPFCPTSVIGIVAQSWSPKAIKRNSVKGPEKLRCLSCCFQDHQKKKSTHRFYTLKQICVSPNRQALVEEAAPPAMRWDSVPLCPAWSSWKLLFTECRLLFACSLCLFCQHPFLQRLQDSTDSGETPVSAAEHLPTHHATLLSHAHTTLNTLQTLLSHKTDQKTVAALLWWQLSGVSSMVFILWSLWPAVSA